MKKLILLFSVIMLISVISCTSTTTSNADLYSQIVGTWEAQAKDTFSDKINKHKFVFNADKKFNEYYYISDGYVKSASGDYSIDNENSRLIITFKERCAELMNKSMTMTFAISGKEMILKEALVGGDPKTLIGVWNSYFSYEGDFKEKIYEFRDDNVVTAKITGIGMNGNFFTETARANWIKKSNNEVSFYNSDNESIFPNNTVFYQIIGMAWYLPLEKSLMHHFSKK